MLRQHVNFSNSSLQLFLGVTKRRRPVPEFVILVQLNPLPVLGSSFRLIISWRTHEQLKYHIRRTERDLRRATVAEQVLD